MKIKCEKCGKITESHDGRPKICAACALKESIDNGNVRYDVKPPKERKFEVLKKKYPLPGWVLFPLNMLFLLLFFGLVIVHLTASGRGWYTEEGEVLFVIFLFMIGFLTALVAGFTVFDIISSLVNMPKENEYDKKRRKERRGTFVIWMLFWPMLVYLAIFKFLFIYIKIFIGDLDTPSSSGTASSAPAPYYVPSAFDSDDNSRKGSGYVDSAGFWREPGEGYVDAAGFWREPGKGYVDASGVWRNPGEGYVDNSGYWRQPGEGYVDAAGHWRNG